MNRFTLDTDTFSLYLRNDLRVCARIVEHAASEIAISIVTYEELWDGWQAVLRKVKTAEETGRTHDRLAETLNELRRWPVMPFSTPAIEIRNDLKKLKLNIGSNDLKIAAIALHANAIVVTRNVRDFRRVPGLRVENWADATA